MKKLFLFAVLIATLAFAASAQAMNNVYTAASSAGCPSGCSTGDICHVETGIASTVYYCTSGTWNAESGAASIAGQDIAPRSVTADSLNLAGLGNVAGVTVTPTGTTGSTTYQYEVVALDGNGQETAGTVVTIINGNATLSLSNYNAITWTAKLGSSGYSVYRTTTTGSYHLGHIKIGETTNSFADTGIAALDSKVPNTTDQTGSVQINNLLFGPSANPTVSFNSTAAQSGLPGVPFVGSISMNWNSTNTYTMDWFSGSLSEGYYTPIMTFREIPPIPADFGSPTLSFEQNTVYVPGNLILGSNGLGLSFAQPYSCLNNDCIDSAPSGFGSQVAYYSLTDYQQTEGMNGSTGPVTINEIPPILGTQTAGNFGGANIPLIVDYVTGAVTNSGTSLTNIIKTGPGTVTGTAGTQSPTFICEYVLGAIFTYDLRLVATSAVGTVFTVGWGSASFTYSLAGTVTGPITLNITLIKTSATATSPSTWTWIVYSMVGTTAVTTQGSGTITATDGTTNNANMSLGMTVGTSGSITCYKCELWRTE